MALPRVCPHCGGATTLSPREIELMRVIKSAPGGLDAEAIKDRLGVSLRTVWVMICRVRQKLGPTAIRSMAQTYFIGSYTA
jgi:DNA-binding CsgD family transcriptional regulator